MNIEGFFQNLALVEFYTKWIRIMWGPGVIGILVSGNFVSERHPLYKVLSIENFDRNAVKAAFLAKKNEQRVKLKDKRLKKGMLGPCLQMFIRLKTFRVLNKT